MPKNVTKEQAVEVTADMEADASAAVQEVLENGEARNRANARQFIVPTEQEDAVVTVAAMSDPDAIPFTDAQWAQVKVKRGSGRPTQEATKLPTSILLDARVVEAFKATGNGWQARMNDVLLEYADVHDMLHA
jgi:uncharacterized protein (DUF4415 family)